MNRDTASKTQCADAIQHSTIFRNNVEEKTFDRIAGYGCQYGGTGICRDSACIILPDEVPEDHSD